MLALPRVWCMTDADHPQQEPSDPEALLPKLARLQSVRSDVEQVRSRRLQRHMRLHLMFVLQQCNARRQRLSELCEKLQELHAQLGTTTPVRCRACCGMAQRAF